VTLTKSNQGYHDRIQRAKSWVTRAEACAALDWEDDHGQFVFYWIALSALCGWVDPAALDKGRRNRGTRTRVGYSDDDAAWFLRKVCELDGDGTIRAALDAVKPKADNLLRDKYLMDLYWRKASPSRVERRWRSEHEDAQQHFRDDDVDKYLALVLRRMRVLRNQVFHGGTTDRISLGKHSVSRAVGVLEVLLPAFLSVMQRHGKDTDWPLIPYPRRGSPQSPEPRSEDTIGR
jgi:hypothetical protein